MNTNIFSIKISHEPFSLSYTNSAMSYIPGSEIYYFISDTKASKFIFVHGQDLWASSISLASHLSKEVIETEEACPELSFVTVLNELSVIICNLFSLSLMAGQKSSVIYG